MRGTHRTIGALSVALLVVTTLSLGGQAGAQPGTASASVPHADRPSAPDSGASSSLLWSPVSSRSTAPAEGDLQLRGTDHVDITFDRRALRGVLNTAPDEGAAGRPAPLVIDLPTPTGGFARFSIVDTPVMSPELAAKLPDVRTYAGVGVDDPTATVRLDLTPAGFHAQVLSSHGRWYIDPRNHRRGGVHTSYFAADLVNVHDYVEVGVMLPDGTIVDAKDAPVADTHDDHDHEAARSSAARSSGEELTTYRLAVAATGEYTFFHRGSDGNPSNTTVEDGQTAIVAAVNRLNGVYEQEVAARFELVDNSTIVFTDGASDLFNNDSAGTLINQSQQVIDDRIGSANYDIGHTFSTGAGGLAQLGVIGQAGSKARGVTGMSTPVGDPYVIDYVAHEIGHQFGGNHTFSGQIGSCAGGNGNSSTAVEPGSGITIMAYAGICGADNLASNSVPYFHAVSYDEMRDEMESVPNVGTDTNPANTVPNVGVAGGSTFTIPPRTPFVLSATGSDADGDTLTYSWEQLDAGALRTLATVPKPSGNLFTFVVPSTSKSRYFPALDTIAAGNTNAATGDCSAVAVVFDCITEFLPTTARTMNFRVTARDGAAGLNNADVAVVVAGTDRFRVTAPNGGESLTSRNDTTVTWEVAATDVAPVDTPTVDILLSSDGGLTFPTTLATDVPNDGSHAVRVPHQVGADARIMVRGHGNIFFDTSDADVTIVAGTSAPTAPRSVTGTPGNKSVRVRWTAPSDDGGAAVNRYTVTASPGGRTCTTTGALTCTVTGLTNGRSYRFTVKARTSIGTGPASVQSAALVPFTVPGKPRAVQVTAKNNGIKVSWTAPASNGGRAITRYVATASPGGKTCSTDGARSCTIKRLNDSTTYRIRVKAKNPAGFGAESDRSAAVRPL